MASFFQDEHSEALLCFLGVPVNQGGEQAVCKFILRTFNAKTAQVNRT